MAARALHERGVERASAVLHRNVGRLQQRVDELDYRMRGRAQIAAAVRRGFPWRTVVGIAFPPVGSSPGYSSGSGAGGDHGVFE